MQQLLFEGPTGAWGPSNCLCLPLLALLTLGTTLALCGSSRATAGWSLERDILSWHSELAVKSNIAWNIRRVLNPLIVGTGRTSIPLSRALCQHPFSNQDSDHDNEEAGQQIIRWSTTHCESERRLPCEHQDPTLQALRRVRRQAKARIISEMEHWPFCAGGRLHLNLLLHQGGGQEVDDLCAVHAPRRAAAR